MAELFFTTRQTQEVDNHDPSPKDSQPSLTDKYALAQSLQKDWLTVPLGKTYERAIHLLYVPTMFCNLDCNYCYLGEQTSTANVKKDSQTAVSTLNHALNQLDKESILAFNVSLHGGEVTTLPVNILAQLFEMINQYYLKHFDALTARGYRKTNPHIKTNLYKFGDLYDLLDQHKVSISASIDLPLRLHDEHRVLKNGASWRKRTEQNIRKLGSYPHKTKISATLSQEHLNHTDEIIADIWYIHRELGFDMTNFNLMFAFESDLNETCGSKVSLTPATQAQQIALYNRLYAEFVDTELEIGLRRHWFDEFSPSYCTNSINCGEKFYLLQGDGDVYSCVRGQGIAEFNYGNIFTSPFSEILATGANKINLMHQQQGMDNSCQACSHLSLCNTGCPVVKFQQDQAKSYTCQLQKHWYADNPLTFKALDESKRPYYLSYYQKTVHPNLALSNNKSANKLNSMSKNTDSNIDPNIHSNINSNTDPIRAKQGLQSNSLNKNKKGSIVNLHLPKPKINVDDIDVATPNDFTNNIAKTDNVVKTDNIVKPSDVAKTNTTNANKLQTHIVSKENSQELTEQTHLDKQTNNINASASLTTDAPPLQSNGVFQLPSDITDTKNTLPALINADPILTQLYREDAFVLQLNDDLLPLSSQILKTNRQWYTVGSTDKIVIHVDSRLFDVGVGKAGKERLRNTLYLQMLTDKQVVYGDEERTKQAHLFTHQLWVDFMQPSDWQDGYLMANISDLIRLYQVHYQPNERLNLFFTTLYLREYHYQKHKQNGFYHIQAMNLPFQNFEFYYFVE